MKKQLFIFLILLIYAFLINAQTCSDSILNQDETSIDCGGVCGGSVVNADICNATVISSDGTCLSNQSNNCGSLELIDICLPTDKMVGVYYKFPLIPYPIGHIRVIISNSNFSNNKATIFLLKGDDCNNPELIKVRKIKAGNDTVYFEGFNTEKQYYLFVASEIGYTGNFDICVTQFNPLPSPVPYREGDCNSAINVCDLDSFNTSPNPSYGSGSIQEVSYTYFPNGEQNSTWFMLTTKDSGALGFNIESLVNYDYALYDITETGCTDLINQIPIRSNTSNNSGCTGIDVATSSLKIPQQNTSSSSFQDGIYVKKNETYALVVNTASDSSIEFNIKFKGVSLKDTVPPMMESAYFDLTDSSIVVIMNEYVKCSLGAWDIDSFSIRGTATGNDYRHLVNAKNITCKEFPIPSSTEVRFKFDSLSPDENLNICVTKGGINFYLYDYCGNVIKPQCIELIYQPPSCSDGFLNQDETSIDCGGVCGNAVNSTKATAITLQTDSTVLYNQTTQCGVKDFAMFCIPDSTFGVYYKFKLPPVSNKIEIGLNNSIFGKNAYAILIDSATSTVINYKCLDSLFVFNQLYDTKTYYIFISTKLEHAGNFDIYAKAGIVPPGIPNRNYAQDCSSGIAVCNTIYSETDAYTGFGSVEEVFNSCLTSGEKNSVWYIIKPQETADFGFEITSFPFVDYDFALYDITEKGCAGVPSSTPIRCNYCDKKDTTGIDVNNSAPKLPNLGVSGGISCNSMMNGVEAKSGETYALIISNYTADNTGYKLEFFGASVFDTTGPMIDSSYIDQNDSAIIVKLNEPVSCGSIVASDFKIYNIDSSALFNANLITNYIDYNYSVSKGVGCIGYPGEYTQFVQLKLKQVLPDSNYRVSLKSNSYLQDICGNVADSSVAYFSAKKLCRDFEVNAEVLQHISCNYTLPHDGKIKATTNLGSDTIVKFSLNGFTFTTDSIFKNLSPKTYTIYAVYDEVCIQSTTATIQLPTLISSTTYTTDVLCFRENNGTVTIDVSGGTPPYAINWNGLDTLHLTKGNYMFNVKDSMMCSYNFNFTIQEPTELKIVATNSVLDITGNQGEITCASSGGSGNVTYSINNINYQDSTIFDGLAGGFYKVYAKDTNNCVDSVTVFVDTEQGISDVLNDIIQIYPNPSNGEVNFSPVQGKITISVFNELSQKIIYKEKITKNHQYNLEKGIYFVQIESEKGVFYKKLIVQ